MAVGSIKRQPPILQNPNLIFSLKLGFHQNLGPVVYSKKIKGKLWYELNTCHIGKNRYNKRLYQYKIQIES